MAKLIGRSLAAALIGVSIMQVPLLNGLVTSTEPEGWVQDFEGQATGADPVGWLDTGAWNSMEPDESLFSVVSVGGSQVLGTSSRSTNVHSHFVAEPVSAAGGSTLSGRMQMTASNSGIGVTVLSDYPNSDSYYRLRRFSGGGGSFQLSPHGTSFTSGTVDTGVVPDPDVWYEFEIAVTDAGSATEVRARVWESGAAKPQEWQADAVDASASRLTEGSVGVWSMRGGSKYWDDFVVSGASEPEPPPPEPDPEPVSLVTEVVGDGTVVVDPVQEQYVAGDVVALTATPGDGQLFVGWSGDVSGSENPLTVTLAADGDATTADTTTVIATFESEPPPEPDPEPVSLVTEVVG